MEKIFRLFDFNIYTNNENNDDDDPPYAQKTP